MIKLRPGRDAYVKSRCSHQERRLCMPRIQPVPGPCGAARPSRSYGRRRRHSFTTVLDSIRPSLYKAPRSSRSLQPRARRAQVAQLVEHVTENHGVGGSIPPLGTTALECN
jgi:hypothetical protein